jgi:hypothetical protein
MLTCTQVQPAVDQRHHMALHCGVRFGFTPIFRDLIPMLDMYICILHFLLRIVGHVATKAIANTVTDDKKAEAVTHYLHAYLHVYVPPLKSASKGEAVKQMYRAMAFTGAEAERVIEHFGDLVDLVYDIEKDGEKVMVTSVSDVCVYHCSTCIIVGPPPLLCRR